MKEPLPTDLRVYLKDGFFHCSDGAGIFVREATSDEKLLWAELERLRAPAYEALDALGAAVAARQVPGTEQYIVERLYLALNGETQAQANARDGAELRARIRADDPELGLFAGTSAAKEIERLQRELRRAQAALVRHGIEEMVVEPSSPVETQGNAALELVHKQACDDGLWFKAQTAPEAYLQQELRRLHAAVEGEPIAFRNEIRAQETPAPIYPYQQNPQGCGTLNTPTVKASERQHAASCYVHQGKPCDCHAGLPEKSSEVPVEYYP